MCVVKAFLNVYCLICQDSVFGMDSGTINHEINVISILSFWKSCVKMCFATFTVVVYYTQGNMNTEHQYNSYVARYFAMCCFGAGNGHKC